MKIALWLAVVLITSDVAMTQPVKRDLSRHYYTLHFPQGNAMDASAHARSIAQSLHVRYEGPVGELKTYYLVSSPLSTKRDDQDDVLAAFEEHKKQGLVRRETSWSMVNTIERQVFRRRIKRGPLPREYLERAPVKLQGAAALKLAQNTLGIHDPGFPMQWHLVNQERPGLDINVVEVWRQGVTGNGSTVAILDDGLDYESEDLADNFFAEGSYDFNDHTPLPKPRLWDDTHGTRCAGQISAVKNNVCGVGIAHGAKVAGVRILSSDISDADEAAALNYRYQENDIYSCSWGPPDTGETMEAPTGILADAFKNGIENGRGGKGSIYVFATGNGAMSNDNCNFDGYTNSIYTITVGALDHTDNHPLYSESCSAQLVVTYSSGGGQFIYTTNVGKTSCSDSHGGTSAAAPNAAGIFALVLSVRPDLTWRDMQHLCVQTAEPVQLGDADWKLLPSGRIYNHKFGYGKLNTYTLIEAAKTFKHVGPQTWFEIPITVNATIPDSTHGHKVALQSTLHITPEMIKAAGLARLEHITATVNIEHQQRGNLVVSLSSPNKVISELATERPSDKSTEGIVDWKFMSVKHWEEDPVGDWTLMVYDVSHPEKTGQLLDWTLTLFGEMDPEFKDTPAHTLQDIPDAAIKTDQPILHVSVVSSTSSEIETASIPSRPTRMKTTALPPPTPTTTTAAAAPTAPTTTTTTTSNSESVTTADVAKETYSPSSEIASSTISVPGAETPSADTSGVEGEEKNESKTSTTVYGVVGSAAIFGLAAAVFAFKRKQRASAVPPVNTHADPDGFEFSILGDEEEEEEELDRDGRPLLNSTNNHH
ncbi:peptidase S8/S53 domain-containing protein [Spinellus fusiger]|nr:peptidase S8/S53 domain-containing protein [Spinellus fusiger]